MLFSPKALILKVFSELKQARSDHDDIGIQGVYRLNVAVDGQTAD
jgi:hypothetical protein